MRNIYILLLAFVCGVMQATKPIIGFIENKGQIHDQNFKPNTAVKYLLSIPGMNIQLKANSFSYDTYTVEQKSTETNRETVLTKLKHPKVENIYHFHRVDVEFIGANTQPEIIAEHPSETYYNYYTTGTCEQGATNVRSYEKVTYKNIYPNIDLEFIAKEGKLKYNFIVHYGGDMNVIKWKYHGANASEIKNNKVSIAVKHGEFNEAIPESYITFNSQKAKQVKVSFERNQNGVFGFASNQKIAISPNQDLVIDPTPTVVWSTYFGGTGVELFNASCLDAIGNVYITGYTQSTSAIATVGAHQVTYGGGFADVVVLKFNNNGLLKWATYYGRNGDDEGTGIAVGNSNDLFVNGFTSSSTAITTTSSHQVTYGGGMYDGLLIKFDTSGVRQWCTYYGGNNYDDSNGCSLDNAGNIFITGSTNSTGGISTVGAHQTSFGGTYDAYLVKFNTNGVRQWGTYYGGSGDDGTNTCENDASGNIYFGGVANSNTGISTLGAHQVTYTGNNNGFLAKFDANGVRQWGTYYGSDTTTVKSIHYDAVGKSIFIAGFTNSTFSISTASSHQTTYGGGMFDAYLAHFDTNGVQQWATYYGGVNLDAGNYITSDNSYVYLCGTSNSSSSISTPNSYQPIFGGSGGNSDAFLVQFNKNGVRQWGTYFGDFMADGAYSINIDALGNLFLVGHTSSPNLSTPGAYQTSPGGNSDGFCAKFNQLIITGIKEISINVNLLIYPNPNSGSFTIQTKGDVVLEIVNELGQVVRNIKLDASNNHQTNITGLADGVYCLKDKLSGTIIKNKIVVVR